MKIKIVAGLILFAGLWAEPINTYSAIAVDARSGYAALYSYYPLVTGCFNERGVLVRGNSQWAPFNPSLWLGYAPLRHLELSFALPYYSDFDTTNGFGDPLVQAKYQYMEEPVAAAVHLWFSLPLGTENFSTGSFDLTVGGLATKELGKFVFFGNIFYTITLPTIEDIVNFSYSYAAEYDFNDIFGGFIELNGYLSSSEIQFGLLPGITFSPAQRFSIDLGLFVPVMGKNCDASWTPCGFVCYSF